MAMGEYTLRVPHQRPTSLPQGCTVRQVMAFGTANRQKVYWFLAKSEDEIKYEYNFFFHVYFFPRLCDVSVHKLPTRPIGVSSSIRMKNDATFFLLLLSSSSLAPTPVLPLNSRSQKPLDIYLPKGRRYRLVFNRFFFFFFFFFHFLISFVVDFLLPLPLPPGRLTFSDWMTAISNTVRIYTQYCTQ